MKKIDIKSINVKRIDCHSGSLLQFEHEGGAVYYSAADAGFIDFDEAMARATMSSESEEFERGLTCDVFVRSNAEVGEPLFEPIFRASADLRLGGLGVKLGKWHNPGQWYELEAI